MNFYTGQQYTKNLHKFIKHSFENKYEVPAYATKIQLQVMGGYITKGNLRKYIRISRTLLYNCEQVEFHYKYDEGMVGSRKAGDNINSYKSTDVYAIYYANFYNLNLDKKLLDTNLE